MKAKAHAANPINVAGASMISHAASVLLHCGHQLPENPIAVDPRLQYAFPIKNPIAATAGESAANQMAKRRAMGSITFDRRARTKGVAQRGRASTYAIKQTVSSALIRHIADRLRSIICGSHRTRNTPPGPTGISPRPLSSNLDLEGYVGKMAARALIR